MMIASRKCKANDVWTRLELKEDANSGGTPEDRTIMFDHHIRYHLNASCNNGKIAALNSKKYNCVFLNLLKTFDNCLFILGSLSRLSFWAAFWVLLDSLIVSFRSFT